MGVHSYPIEDKDGKMIGTVTLTDEVANEIKVRPPVWHLYAISSVEMNRLIGFTLLAEPAMESDCG